MSRISCSWQAVQVGDVSQMQHGRVLCECTAHSTPSHIQLDVMRCHGVAASRRARAFRQKVCVFVCHAFCMLLCDELGCVTRRATYFWVRYIKQVLHTSPAHGTHGLAVAALSVCMYACYLLSIVLPHAMCSRGGCEPPLRICDSLK